MDVLHQYDAILIPKNVKNDPSSGRKLEKGRERERERERESMDQPFLQYLDNI
jgi:hypothetical protein